MTQGSRSAPTPGLNDLNLVGIQKNNSGNGNYPRLRFGISNEFAKGKQVDYVLGKWGVEEMKTLDERIKVACDGVNSFMFEGIERAMTKYNRP